MQRTMLWNLVLLLVSPICLHAGEDRINVRGLDHYQRDGVADEWDMMQREVQPQLPPSEEWSIFQREIAPEEMLQREVIPAFPIQQQRRVEVPLLIHGAPVLSPRGRRPASHTSGTGNVDNNLTDFPPGRPSHSNIDNICGKNRPKSKYGRLALPQTGFSHLRRQGNAVNNLEDGYAECCQKKDRLRCVEGVWKSGLEDFCSEEFSVKTRHYHCCRKDEPERESCFSSSAPNPSYSFPVPLQEIGSADLPPRGRSLNSCPPSSPKCQRHSNAELPNLSFPPGEPKSSNIHNICKLRKFRPVYPKNLLPLSGFGHYVRQAKAINHVENEFKKCCKEENVACAHTAWEKMLVRFCSQERSIKTRPHDCCKKKERPSMYSCFSLEAPYPEYDREVESIDLSNVTQDDLQKLCRDHKLLTKQKQIPQLVSDLRESCCNVSADAVPQCTNSQKEKFADTLCGTKKAAGKDSPSCCKKQDQERDECFNVVLQNVSVAVSHRMRPHKEEN